MTDSQFGDKNLDLDGGWVNEQAKAIRIKFYHN